MQLNYWRETWPLNTSECPCDVHFVEFLRDRAIGGRSVFHFGSGEHHLLGIENARFDVPNQVLSVTASRQEHESYVERVIADPSLANTYKVLFADIYTLSPLGLPRFDVVSLFHLGEFWDAARSAYAPLDDARLLEVMIDRTEPGGFLCFYHGSNGWPAARPLVDRAVGSGRLRREDDFLSLVVCRRA